MNTCTLYGIPNCGTVKKATEWLKANNIAFEWHDYKKNGISDQKVAHWLEQYPWERLINRAGTTWKKLSEQEKTAVTNNAAAALLMTQQTSLIKRPILEINDQIVAVGFDADTYAALYH